MSRPSDGFELDELKEEYDWLYEFHSHMAERITYDPDVHNLADYVSKLEGENEGLRKILGKMYCLVTELCVVSVGGRRIGPKRVISPSALSHLAEKLRDIGVDVEGTYEGD